MTDAPDILMSAPVGVNGLAALAEALEREGLPTGDLHERDVRFFAFERNRRVVGFGGFEPHGDAVLLRSIVVQPDLRGEGFGAEIVQGLLDLAASEGARRAFLLTTNAMEFFERRGFEVIDRAEAPRVILATRQAVALCPASASMMARTIAT